MSWEKSLDKATRYKMLADYYQTRDINKYNQYNGKYQKHLVKFVEQYEMPRQIPVYQRPFGKKGMVRILHTATYAPVPVDVYVNQKLVAGNVPFSGITGYLPLSSGDYKVEIFPAGRKDQAVLSQSIKVRDRRAYTLIAADVRTTNKIQLLVYEDDVKRVAGRAKVRFIHMSPDAGRVDIAIKGGNVIFSNVGYRDARFMTLNPGVYTLEIRPAGSKQRALYTIPNVTLNKGKIYTLFALGKVKGNPIFRVLMVEDKQ